MLSIYMIGVLFFLLLPEKVIGACTYHNLIKFHYRPIICSNMTLDAFIHEIQISQVDTILTLENINFRELRTFNKFPYSKIKLLTITYNEWKIREDAFKRFSFLYSLQIIRANLSNSQFSGFEINDNYELERMRLTNNNVTSLGNVCLRNPYLKTLHITHNFIRSVETGTFSSCSIMTEINLSHNRIEFIEPGSFNAKIKTLLLKNNNLTHVLSGAFIELQELDVLDLSDCKILTVSQNAFNGLIKLETLKLNNNEIKAIDKNTFHDTTELITLEIANNKITQLDSQTFSNLNNLEDLNLNHNPITIISEDTFTGLIYLDTLNLTNLELEDINGAFNPLANIKHLRLDFNKLTDLEKSMFQLLPTLNTLNLSYNEIDAIDNGTFSNLKQLQILDLSHNELEVIDCKMTRVDLPDMEELDLSYNYIRLIEVCAFIHIGNLTTLKLEFNNMTNIIIGTFTTLHNLRQLSVANNHLYNLDATLLFPLNNLQVLDVSGNNLNNWDIEPAISYLVNIQHIDISENDWPCEHLIKIIKFFADKHIDCSPRKSPVLSEQNVNGIRCTNQIGNNNIDFVSLGSGSIFNVTVKDSEYLNLDFRQMIIIGSVLVTLFVACGCVVTIFCIRILKKCLAKQRDNVLNTMEQIFQDI